MTPSIELDAANAQVFRVTLGSLGIEVVADDAERAIQAAKGKWCAEYPRLWDVIQQADPNQFTAIPSPKSEIRKPK